MSAARRLFKNTGVLIVAQGFQTILSFYLIITISKLLGVGGFGAYTTIFSYLAIFQIFASFGLKNLLTREIAQNRSEVAGYLTNSSLISVPFSIICIGLLLALVYFLGYEGIIITATLILSISLIASALIDCFEGVLVGLEKLDIIGIFSIAENLLRVVLSLLFLYKGHGLISLVVIFTAVRFAKLLFYLLYVHFKIEKIKFKVNLESSRKLIKSAKTFAFIMACVTIYWKADVIMLSKIAGVSEVGIYSAAFRILFLGMILVDSFVNSLYPVISNYFKSSRENFEIACRKASRLLILVALPISIAVSLQAEKIILLLFNEEYLPAAKVLQILIWCLIPYALSQIFAYALLASNQQKVDLGVNASSMVANIVLNLILIPRYGIMGATIATFVSIHLYVALQIPFIINKLIKFDAKVFLNDTIRILAVALVMVAFIILLKDINLFLIIPLSFFIYSISVYMLNVLSESDREMISRLLRKAT